MPTYFTHKSNDWWHILLSVHLSVYMSIHGLQLVISDPHKLQQLHIWYMYYFLGQWHHSWPTSVTQTLINPPGGGVHSEKQMGRNYCLTTYYLLIIVSLHRNPDIILKQLGISFQYLYTFIFCYSKMQCMFKLTHFSISDINSLELQNTVGNMSIRSEPLVL